MQECKMARSLHLGNKPLVHGDKCFVAQMAARPAICLPALPSRREDDPKYKVRKSKGDSASFILAKETLVLLSDRIQDGTTVR